MSQEQVFAYVPRGRKVEGPDTPDDYVGTVGVLRRADKELVKLLRRDLREIAERDLVQEGKTWTDRKTGEEFRLVTSFVDVTAPQEMSVTAFTVRGGHVCYLRPLGASLPQDKSVVLGTFNGGWKA